MLSRNNLPKINKGDIFKAADFNKLRGEVTRQGKVKATPPLAVRSDATGVTFYLTDLPAKTVYGACSVSQHITTNTILNGTQLNSPPDKFQNLTYTSPGQIAAKTKGVYLAMFWGRLVSWSTPVGWSQVQETATVQLRQNNSATIDYEEAHIGAWPIPSWNPSSGLVTGGQYFTPTANIALWSAAVFDPSDYLTINVEYSGTLGVAITGEFALYLLGPVIPS